MEVVEKSLGEVHFGAAEFRDARLTNRLVAVANQLIAHPNETFPKKFQNPKDLQAFYRLMKNDKVTHASVLATHRDVTLERMRTTPGVVLAIQDTTTLDYSGLDAIEDLAPIGNGHGRGYSCHNCLAVVAESREVLGLVAQVLHRRRKIPKGEKRAARQQHPQRESRLWKTISKQLPAAPTDGPAGQLWVEVADRGADITEFLDYEEEVGKKYLVRSQHNRWIEQKTADKAEKIKLHTLARALPAAGSRPLEVQEKPGQPARMTTVSVSWQAVTLLPPRERRGEERGVPLETWVVRVWEEQPPTGVKALEWILLTNVPVQSLAEAFERVDWYSRRWIIEIYQRQDRSSERLYRVGIAA